VKARCLAARVALPLLALALAGDALAQAPTPRENPSRQVFSDDQQPGACVPAVHDWARACSRRGARVEAFQCPEGPLVVVDVAGLRVELVRDPRRGFRRAGAWGVSPVGEFSDWNAVPARLRNAFEQVVACATENPLPEGSCAVPVVRRAAPRTPPPPRIDAPRAWQCVPWLLLAALACGLAARGRRLSRLSPRPLVASLAGLAAVVGLRALVAPSAFFHQNGHGPSWIAHTVTAQRHLYGPGFREVFGWIIRLAPAHPEAAVFALQSLLGAAGVAAVYATARAVGAGRLIALSACLAVTLDPVFARASRSESHYAAQASLYLLAAAILARAVGPLRSKRFALACVSAGLVVAQAMRMHPVGWVAGAVVPAVMLLGPGALSRRAKRTAAGFAIVGLVCALAVLPTMRAVMGGALGAQWAPRHLSSVLTAALRGALPALVGAVAAVMALRDVKRVLPRALVGVAVFAATAMANVLPPGGVPPWVSGAYVRLYAPVAVAALVAVMVRALTTRTRERVAAAVVAAVTVMLVAQRAPALTRLPTDARELQYALGWREGLPEGARVVYLERAAEHILVLPIYSGFTPRGVRSIPLRDTEPPASLAAFGEAWWYHSSACETAEGRAFCEAVERANALTPVWLMTLPAAPSVPYLPYAESSVRIGLYRATPTSNRTPHTGGSPVPTTSH
jgi:hypothetical protein